MGQRAWEEDSAAREEKRRTGAGRRRRVGEEGGRTGAGVRLGFGQWGGVLCTDIKRVNNPQVEGQSRNRATGSSPRAASGILVL